MRLAWRGRIGANSDQDREASAWSGRQDRADGDFVVAAAAGIPIAIIIAALCAAGHAVPRRSSQEQPEYPLLSAYLAWIKRVAQGKKGQQEKLRLEMPELSGSLLPPATRSSRTGRESENGTQLILRCCAENVQSLNLSGRHVTDAGLKELAVLKDLQVLDLFHTQVTDAGLKELAGLKSLQELHLNDRARISCTLC